MTKGWILRVSGVVLLTALPACGGAPSPGATPSPGAASLADLEALYRARQDSALLDFTEADVHFMQGMIGHHAQALVMSAMAPTHTESRDLRTLAARTINAQRDEIGTMTRWLEDRGQRVPDIHVMEDGAMVHGLESAVRMPGMLTPDQMARLDAARDREFDRLFLTLMIQHHRGAVDMVHELFATDGAALDDTVFKLASDIQVDQNTEVARMQLMLEGMGDAGRSP